MDKIKIYSNVEKHLPIRIRASVRRKFFSSQPLTLYSTNNLPLKQYGFKVSSQSNEDGIIQHIFNQIGTTNKTFIEFGCGDGIQCNTANLSLNHNWKGLLMDGSTEHLEIAKTVYRKNKNVIVAKHWITKENLNRLFLEHGIKGEIDLLSIDLDGNDYYLLEAITSVNARVLIAEYNRHFGEQNITVMYDEAFDRFTKHPSGAYFGVSLKALTQLAKSKGYVLIYANGINAFYIRKDLANAFKEINPDECFTIEDLEAAKKDFEAVKKLPYHTPIF